MLGDGTHVPKHHTRVVAYGSVDEANAAIGVAAAAIRADSAQPNRDDILDELQRIQNDLFDVGADLCLPVEEAEESGVRLRITGEQIHRLELQIDRFNNPLPSLESFILPGGSTSAATLHHARTVCRRAERCIAQLLERAPHQTSTQTMIYMNRLSDLLFVLARVLNQSGTGDVLWQPGGADGNTTRRED